MPVYDIISPDGEAFEIDAPEDATPEQIQAYAQKNFSSLPGKTPQPSTFENVAAGFNRGVDDFGDTVGKYTGLNYLRDKAAQGMEAVGLIPEGSREKLAPENRLKSYNETYGDSMAAGVGRFGGQVASTMLVPGGVVTKGLTKNKALANALRKVPNLVKRPAAAALAGAEGAALTSEGYDEPLTNQLAQGAVGGVIGDTVLRGAGRIWAPLRKKPGATIDKNAQILKDAGVPTSPAMETGSGFLGKAEHHFRQFPTTENFQRSLDDMRQSAFNKAVFAKAGIDADQFTDEVSAAAKERFSGEYDALFADKMIDLSPDDKELLTKGLTDFIETTSGDRPSRVEKVVNDLLRRDNVPGRVYQQSRRSLDQIKGAYRPDMKNVRNILDDIAARRLDPEAANKLGGINNRYHAYKAIENAAAASNDIARKGDIAARALEGAVKSRRRGAFARREKDIDALAVAGAQHLKAPPDSGTAGHQQIINMMTNPLSMGAGGMGLYYGGLPGGFAGYALPIAGYALRPAIQKAYYSGYFTPKDAPGFFTNPDIQDLMRKAAAKALRNAASTANAEKRERNK